MVDTKPPDTRTGDKSAGVSNGGAGDAMTTLYAVLGFAGIFPFLLVLRSNRATSLRYATDWAAAAWLTWGYALLASDPAPMVPEAVIRYLALCMTAAAGVAVLGARRPQLFAWNFVVLGLLVVMVLPLVVSLVLGIDRVDSVWVFFLSATLSVGLLNYLPTRSAPGVLLAALAVGAEMTSLFAPDSLPNPNLVSLFHLLILVTPWGVWACWRGERSNRSEFDRVWLDFRDRFGLFWAQRVREQFNRAAANAGWPVHLSWRGLHRTVRGMAIVPAEQDAMLETLHAALQRFGPSARAENKK
jgi:hypothetical protein